MNLNEVFKKIEMALTPSEEATPVEEVKVEMANMRLANGVVIEAESFEAGQNVFLVGEDDEKVAAPVGEHELEDGRVLVIEEEGQTSGAVRCNPTSVSRCTGSRTERSRG